MNSSQTRFVNYPAPAGVESSPDFTLKVNGETVFVYQARVSAVPLNQVWPGHQRSLDQTEIASFAYFDFSGRASLEITSARAIQQVVVRPQSYRIQPTFSDSLIRFDLDHPCQVVVEVNGWHHALHLFANPLETNPPQLGDPHTHYFGPGIHEIGKFQVHSGETVYIAGGAVCYGSLNASAAHDIKICGRGILDASKFSRFDADQIIALKSCQRVDVSGLILRDANVYAVTPDHCQDVTITNLKVIGLWRYNSDGIDICNSQHVLVQDCFVRSFDDSLVVKGYDKPHAGQPATSIEDVVFRNCVVWNDWGRALELGAETQGETWKDITFENIDIIHYVQRAMDIQHCDRAEISHVRFEDIRVEDAITEGAGIEDPRYDPGNASEVGWLIELVIYKIMYSHDKEPGRIKDVIFKNIAVLGEDFPPSNFHGFDAAYLVEDVTIENLTIHGKRITSPEDGHFTINSFVHNLRLV
jgi:polygalacturonase